jgi:dephospho-CoA kinase
MIKRVGITGGIGSGKSFVCRKFSQNFGILIYDSDVRGKILMEQNTELRNMIINEFGEDSFTYDHRFILNKDKFIKLLFNNEESRKKMNSFVHPFVRDEFNEWCNFCIEDDYVLFESAILLDGQERLKTDFNILVVSDLDVRIKRVMNRNSSSEKDIMKRINAQSSDDYKRKLSDVVITNNGNESELDKQIMDIHQKILSL